MLDFKVDCPAAELPNRYVSLQIQLDLMSNKIYVHIGLNIARLILALIFNLSWLIVVSIILWIVFSFETAIIYFIIALLLRPFFSRFIESREKILEKTNDGIANNLSLFANEKSISIEECISTVSFYIAEQMNYSVELYLKKKDVNYLAVIISSFMIFLCYQKLKLFTPTEREAMSKAKAINDDVHNEIQQLNKSINESYKSYLKVESDKLLAQMLNERDKEINAIIDVTYNFISEHLNEKARIEMNDHIHDYLKKYITETNSKFSLALDRRINTSTLLK